MPEETEATVVSTSEKISALTKVRVRWLAQPPSWRWKIAPNRGPSRKAFEILTTDSEHIAFIEAGISQEVLEALVMAPEDVRLLMLRVSKLERCLQTIYDLAFVGATDLSSVRELAKHALENEKQEV